MSSSPRRGRGVEVAPMGNAQRLAYRVVRAVGEIWCRLFWRIEVHGAERLPTTGAFVLSPAHRSNVDFFVVGASVRRVLRFMSKDNVWKSAAAGRIAEWLGSFPVDRERPDRAALRNCERIVAMGDPVVMFPEGTRREGPVIEELQQGAAWVACRARVPIVPMALGFSERAMPIGSSMIRPAKLRIVIGEPLYPDVPLTGRVPRAEVRAVTEQLRGELQRCFDVSRSVDRRST